LPAPDLDLLIDAARHAGSVVAPYWRNDPAVTVKPDGSPVSVADLAADTALRERLMAARPGYGWLSEETPDDAARQSRDRVFIVDPIDGTRAFLAGETAFAHSLAVAEAGRVTAAVVFLPMMDLLYAATADGGATLNGRAIHVSERTTPEGATILAARPMLDPERWPGGVPPMTRAFRASLAWRLCLVAEGTFDATLTLRPAWEWDIAAGALIVARAGGQVSDARGDPIRFNAPTARAEGLIAGPHAICGDLLRRLSA
jgi:myo-inositol-1(or 4)-monophosphatase